MQGARVAAELAADAAESVIADFISRGDWSVTLKTDHSPVTEVDIAAENAIKEVLTKAFPQAIFFGEETGVSDGIPTEQSAGQVADNSGADDKQLRWLVDPIDGTKSFIREMPFYSTQIAFEVNGRLSVGVSNAPAYGERLIAVEGEGVWLNDKPARCSDVTNIADAFLSSGNLTSLATDPARWGRYAPLVAQARRVRGYGDFCHYHQLCCGQTDLIVESDVNILDIAALVVGIREAGGVITDLNGQAVDDRTTSVLAASTALLHESALSMLNAR